MLFLAGLCALLALPARGGITVSPGHLFLNSVHRTITISALNDGDDEREVWMEVKFGYETSDDSGKIFVLIDSAAVDEPSAAGWIECYPRRFNLKPGESQTVRIMARPPAGLSDGEYWSRVIVASKTRLTAQKSTVAPTGTKPGFTIIYQQSVPFHYRVGNVTTGVTIDSLTTALSDTSLNVVTQIGRTGNAAFWGSRTLQLLDNTGTSVYKVTRNAGVYKRMKFIDHISRSAVPAGEYTLSVVFSSEGRSDVTKRDLIKAAPVRSAVSVTIP